jgi:hypothetical protein
MRIGISIRGVHEAVVEKLNVKVPGGTPSASARSACTVVPSFVLISVSLWP